MIVSDRKEQLKLLTIAPLGWTIQKTSEYFAVSNAIVKKARELKKIQGILAEPKQKMGKNISLDLKHAVENVLADKS